MDAATAAFAEHELSTLLSALIGTTGTPEQRTVREQGARVLFAALQPRDAAEVAMAIRAVAGYYTWRAQFAKAHLEDASPDQAARVLALARTEGRVFDVTARTLHRRHNPSPQRSERVTPKREPVEAPPAEPQPMPPPIERYQPRDRHGVPVPLDRWDQLTLRQRRAAYGNPHDRALWDAALEEEAAMIAAQQAADAAASATPVG